MSECRRFSKVITFTLINDLFSLLSVHAMECQLLYQGWQHKENPMNYYCHYHYQIQKVYEIFIVIVEFDLPSTFYKLEYY